MLLDYVQDILGYRPDGYVLVELPVLEELVDMMGFTGEARENAIKSINDYTRYAEQGCDEEYHVNPSALHPIKTPPFYGTRTHFGSDAMTFLCVTGGLRTNEYMQVCQDDDTPIDGLFNTGIMTGDYYAGTYNFVMPGQNLGGVCNCLSHVLGMRLADKDFVFPSGPIERKSTVEDESIQNDGSAFAALKGGSESELADGVYTGVGEGGMNGNIEVEVTITDGKIANVTYKHSETESIGGEALKALAEQTVATNGASVDAVSGATLTSNAYAKAMADALSKAAK